MSDPWLQPQHAVDGEGNLLPPNVAARRLYRWLRHEGRWVIIDVETDEQIGKTYTTEEAAKAAALKLMLPSTTTKRSKT